MIIIIARVPQHHRPTPAHGRLIRRSQAGAHTQVAGNRSGVVRRAGARVARRHVVRAAADLRPGHTQQARAGRPSLARAVCTRAVGGLTEDALAELAVYAGGTWTL